MRVNPTFHMNSAVFHCSSGMGSGCATMRAEQGKVEAEVKVEREKV
jgi:hypothetical protein